MRTNPNGHPTYCRCDACVLPPAADPLNKQQRSLMVEYEGKLAVAVASQTKARHAYDTAGRALFGTANPDADLKEQYDLALADLERATAKVTTLLLERDAAVREAGITLAKVS